MGNIYDYLKHPEVLAIIHDLKELKVHEKEFSDIVDDEGNQYVDLVMEGGGMLGIALVGYVHVLEQMNIRFLQVGGASAGSINALILAAAGPVNQSKAPWIVEKLAGKDLSELIDGDSQVKKLIKRLLSPGKGIQPRTTFGKVLNYAILAFANRSVAQTLLSKLGLNPGQDFINWMTSILEEKNISTYAQLKEVRKQVPAGFRNRRTGNALSSESFERVAIVAADITTETKVVFPEMADLYWKNSEEVNPALFARASMSIPGFFFPFKVNGFPREGNDVKQSWEDKTGYKGEIPKEVVFSDGGIMSNFPIDLFHNFGKVPSAPTFGVKLGVDRSKPHNPETLLQFAGAVFNSARHVHDYDFFMRNPDYQHLVECIETGDHNWLNFSMHHNCKVDLFVRGAQAAARFLKGFNWEEYHNLRSELKSAHEISDRVKILKGKNVKVAEVKADAVQLGNV